MPTPRDFAILNALVTFAAENVPGGLTEEEQRVAQAVGRIAAREAPLEQVRPLTYSREMGDIDVPCTCAEDRPGGDPEDHSANCPWAIVQTYKE